MKNHGKDAIKKAERCTLTEIYFSRVVLRKQKSPVMRTQTGLHHLIVNYFTWYITSFTSFTVRGTSGNAAATRFGA
jgi:hypothetical protein